MKLMLKASGFYVIDNDINSQNFDTSSPIRSKFIKNRISFILITFRNMLYIMVNNPYFWKKIILIFELCIIHRSSFFSESFIKAFCIIMNNTQFFERTRVWFQTLYEESSRDILSSFCICLFYFCLYCLLHF